MNRVCMRRGVHELEAAGDRGEDSRRKERDLFYRTLGSLLIKNSNKQ
jgi:hypothetical protein